jgi:hypothetical protein
MLRFATADVSGWYLSRVFIAPCLSGVARLPNVHFATFTRDAVCASDQKAKIIFHLSQQVHIPFGKNLHNM